MLKLYVNWIHITCQINADFNTQEQVYIFYVDLFFQTIYWLLFVQSSWPISDNLILHNSLYIDAMTHTSHTSHTPHIPHTPYTPHTSHTLHVTQYIQLYITVFDTYSLVHLHHGISHLPHYTLKSQYFTLNYPIPVYTYITSTYTYPIVHLNLHYIITVSFHLGFI